MKKISIILLAILLSACAKKAEDVRKDNYIVRKERTLCTPINVVDRKDRFTEYKDITYKCVFIRNESEYAQDYNAKKKLEKLVKEEQNEQTTLQPN